VPLIHSMPAFWSPSFELIEHSGSWVKVLELRELVGDARSTSLTYESMNDVPQYEPLRSLFCPPPRVAIHALATYAPPARRI
jgi:hypothetical protein